ncbi:hypothetical protein BJ508DRAFT_203240 [Ascobolus immersus RN42]|uniref:DDE Tnp4 domain-containing protein n=1 Tax=Ascobolus immersus RN42 TaxID=1160509 RepID=A0A3N4IMM5_ASCIM|nr:hypothetical protein BJ508DRAFT_212401 [Ascobolus immersus RN42]RPA87382.1 hypothetical protein BJ508DRAFT_203240 [Ascobolus immersus RN42]
MRKRKKALGVIIALAILGVKERNQRRTRFYLTRGDLQSPNNSPWQTLYDAGHDSAFILTTGVDTRVFHFLLQQGGFEHAWNSTPLPRRDNFSVKPRPLGRSLTAAGALGLALHYLNSTMRDVDLHLIFGIPPAVCSRYRRFALTLLLTCLKRLPEAAIRWPNQEEMRHYSDLIVRRHGSELTGAFGMVDGCHLPVACSGSLEVQNAYYNGWCSSHYTSNLFVFAPDGTIIFATINAPGSWHDSAVARNLYCTLISDTPDGFFLIADTAFPASSPTLKGKIKTPPKRNAAAVFQTPEEAFRLVRFFEKLVSARQAAEWGMHALQGPFGRLKIPMSSNDDEFRGLVLDICCRLHNLRTRCVGVNQIKTVYEEVWKQSGVFKDFADMLFKDIHANDRIRRYYVFTP